MVKVMCDPYTVTFSVYELHFAIYIVNMQDYHCLLTEPYNSGNTEHSYWILVAREQYPDLVVTVISIPSLQTVLVTEQ